MKHFPTSEVIDVPSLYMDSPFFVTSHDWDFMYVSFGLATRLWLLSLDRMDL